MTDYVTLAEQAEALCEDTPDLIAVMANVSALVFHTLVDLNWAGFYRVCGEELILGPFQGKVACIRIAKGRGVCGTAWKEDRVLVVPDVHAFAGHITCDSDSRSEIVLPIHRDGEVIAVLDIDSPVLNRFGEDDCEGLTALVKALEKHV